MSGNKKDEEMICALTADEYTALQKGLNALPETMPPRDVWQRIRAQGEAEGLLSEPAAKRSHTAWYLGAGIAAAGVLAAILMSGPAPESDMTTVPLMAEETPTPLTGLTTLQTLMQESRQLESSLRSLPDAPTVQRASTLATVADLEDRIAAIDYQLNDPSIDMSDADRELFWRERVRLMKSLLQLRYAQAQRAAF